MLEQWPEGSPRESSPARRAIQRTRGEKKHGVCVWVRGGVERSRRKRRRRRKTRGRRKGRKRDSLWLSQLLKPCPLSSDSIVR